VRNLTNVIWYQPPNGQCFGTDMFFLDIFITEIYSS